MPDNAPDQAAIEIIHGGISLLDVLPPVRGPAALDAAPKLVTTRGGTQVETRYDWTPTVRSFDMTSSINRSERA